MSSPARRTEAASPSGPGPADVDALARMLTRAFFDDPVQLWLFPDPEQRRRWAPRMFTRLLRRRIRDGVVAANEERTSAAIWEPPGSPALRWWEKLAAAAEFTRALGLRASDAGRGFSEMLARHPPPPYWYLAVLGTDPDHRGGGHAASLVRATLAHCDAHGLPAYLESSKQGNVPYYERLGFEVIGEHRLPDGPLLWLMQRQPR